MRIAFVQSYPVYHDLLSTGEWLARENRDRIMPELAAELGHEVELWAVGRAAGVHPGVGYLIRLFEPTSGTGKTKFHFSDALVDHAGAFQPALCVIKGLDGGAGMRLIDRFLLPDSVPYVLIIGGKYYTHHVRDAAVVLYETAFQRDRLIRPSRPWRRGVPAERLTRLPKSIDTDAFRPMPEVKKEFDVLSAGRLVSRYKRYDALGRLPRHLRIAVAGTGPALTGLRGRYPWISWLGKIDYADMPECLNRSRLFFHSSFRDYYPRVIAEAASCGVPALAFSRAIAGDVLPPERGVRVTRRNLSRVVLDLLDDPGEWERLSANSRAWAISELSRASLKDRVVQVLEMVSKGVGPGDPVPVSGPGER